VPGFAETIGGNVSELVQGAIALSVHFEAGRNAEVKEGVPAGGDGEGRIGFCDDWKLRETRAELDFEIARSAVPALPLQAAGEIPGFTLQGKLGKLIAFP
jgi:hypothetical protein